MSKPSFVVRLHGAEINGSRYPCEGEQIATLVAYIASAPYEFIWFAADIEQVDGPRRIPNGMTTPARISDTPETLAWLRAVPQFVWGSFLAVPADRVPATWPAIRSEDLPFHDIGQAVVEILALDGGELQVYAVVADYLEPLAERFGVAIQMPTDEPWATILAPVTPEWRRRAIADFPSLLMVRLDLDYSPYWLFYTDLLPMVRAAAHEHPDPTLLKRIFDYAEWSLGQGGDLANAAGVSFYEHLFDAREDWVTVLPYLSPAVVRACWPLWEARWELWESRTSRDEVQRLRETLAPRR
jgi:hypothetical protein